MRSLIAKSAPSATKKPGMQCVPPPNNKPLATRGIYELRLVTLLCGCP